MTLIDLRGDDVRLLRCWPTTSAGAAGALLAYRLEDGVWSGYAHWTAVVGSTYVGWLPEGRLQHVRSRPGRLTGGSFPRCPRRADNVGMPYPSRPVREPLPQFRDTNVIHPSADQRTELIRFVTEQYEAGLSLRELAELTDRTQRAVRRALDQAGVPRRPRGAYEASRPTT